jgi:hypothetical protein
VPDRLAVDGFLRECLVVVGAYRCPSILGLGDAVCRKLLIVGYLQKGPHNFVEKADGLELSLEPAGGRA